MKTHIYFVRHAQPDISIKDDILRPLTQKGLADAKRVTQALADKNIKAVYSSPYKRAYDTVKDFADSNGLEIQVIDDFRERKVDNIWVDDFKTFSGKQWGNFEYKLTEGECLREVQERNVSALFTVLGDSLGGNFVVGSHGTALSTVINYFNPMFGYDDFCAIVDRMPYILCLIFNDMDFAGMEDVEL